MTLESDTHYVQLPLVSVLNSLWRDKPAKVCCTPRRVPCINIRSICPNFFLECFMAFANWCVWSVHGKFICIGYVPVITMID